MDVAISQLKLRGPAERAAQARFLIEDGIRTSWPDEDRLVLIRQVALGRTRADARPDERAAQFRGAWDTATNGRRHGGDSGAEDANCVWFASHAEAWRLLLRELLAGRRPLAWYWRLAVPGWQGEAAEPWLTTQLAEALEGRGTLDPVALVETVETAGGTGVLFAAVEQLGAVPGARPIEPVSVPAATEVPPEALAEATQQDAGERAAIETVLTLRARLPAPFIATVETLALRIGPDTPAARRLIERLLLRAIPSLRLAPVRLAAALRVWTDILVTGHLPQLPPASRISVSDTPVPSRKRSAARLENKTTEPAEPDRGAAEPASGMGPEEPLEPVSAEFPAAFAAWFDEQETQFAGLWQTVPALIRLGFREWLAEHPDVAADDGGRRLLRTIARHYRIAADDPALLPLADYLPGEPDFARPWRVGLDRWLWHRARIRLRELVARPGWLRLSEEKLVLRFDPESVDLRLRRLALDVDPGWTDWLGLSIRYLYAGRGEE